MLNQGLCSISASQETTPCLLCGIPTPFCNAWLLPEASYGTATWDPAQEAGTRKVGVAMVYFVFFLASASPLSRVLGAKPWLLVLIWLPMEMRLMS